MWKRRILHIFSLIRLTSTGNVMGPGTQQQQSGSDIAKSALQNMIARKTGGVSNNAAQNNPLMQLQQQQQQFNRQQQQQQSMQQNPSMQTQQQVNMINMQQQQQQQQRPFAQVAPNVSLYSAVGSGGLRVLA